MTLTAGSPDENMTATLQRSASYSITLRVHVHQRAGAGTADALLAGADVSLGLSGPDAASADAVHTMAPGAIVFAMANPTPEVMPEEVREHAAVMAPGRSDYPNQINNALAFPGVFRGALDVRARTINEAMKLAAAQAIAGVIERDELDPEYIVSSVFNGDVAPAGAEAVAAAAAQSGVARIQRMQTPRGEMMGGWLGRLEGCRPRSCAGRWRSSWGCSS